MLHFPFVLIDVFPPNLCDYKFIMIVHVILCLNEREIQKKEKRKIGQEDQMLELTFNFHGALPILTFYENELTLFTEKNKENKSKRKTKKWGERKKKKKKRKRKIEVKRGERKERKKRKNFCLNAHVRKVNFK